jgi:hypothetical protein
MAIAPTATIDQAIIDISNAVFPLRSNALTVRPRSRVRVYAFHLVDEEGERHGRVRWVPGIRGNR